MYGVQSSKSFLVGHRHVEIIGSSKERNKISNNISDRTYKQGQIWLVRRQDFHSFLNLWYGRRARRNGCFCRLTQVLGWQNTRKIKEISLWWPILSKTWKKLDARAKLLFPSQMRKMLTRLVEPKGQLFKRSLASRDLKIETEPSYRNGNTRFPVKGFTLSAYPYLENYDSRSCSSRLPCLFLFIRSLLQRYVFLKYSSLFS